MIRGAGGDGAGPRGDEGGAGSALVDGVFSSFKRSGSLVVTEFFERVILIAIIHDGAIV